jgi:hypothetical protein
MRTETLLPLWLGHEALQAFEAQAGKHRMLLVDKDKALRAGRVMARTAVPLDMRG